MRIQVKIITIVLLTATFSSCDEQLKNTGNVNGFVTDKSNDAAIEGAEVIIGDQNDITGEDGEYFIESLDIGNQIITTIITNYLNYSGEVEIFKDSAVKHDISLVPENTAIVPTDGLIAYYPFNGNASDESGNGNNGTSFRATLTEDRFGNTDKSYFFNGVDNYIEVANDPSLTMGTGNLTVAAWVRISDPSHNHRFVDTGGRQDEGYSLFYYSPQFFGLEGDGNFSVQWRNGGPPPDAGPSRQGVGGVDIADGKWHHVVRVWDRDTAVKAYVDGVLVAREAPKFPSSEDISNVFNLRIGSEAAAVRQLTDGLIDEVAIYNRTLSPEEIWQQYQNGLNDLGL